MCEQVRIKVNEFYTIFKFRNLYRSSFYWRIRIDDLEIIREYLFLRFVQACQNRFNNL